MIQFDACSLNKSLPVLILLLAIAQLDLASAFAWPAALFPLLHLTPASDDQLRGMCAGLGASLDFIVLYQFARIWAKRAIASDRH